MPRIYSGRKKCCEYLIGRSSNRKRSSTVNLSKSLALQQIYKRIYRMQHANNDTRPKSAAFDHIFTGAGCSLDKNDGVSSVPVFELHTDLILNHPLVIFVKTQG